MFQPTTSIVPEGANESFDPLILFKVDGLLQCDNYGFNLKILEIQKDRLIKTVLKLTNLNMAGKRHRDEIDVRNGEQILFGVSCCDKKVHLSEANTGLGSPRVNAKNLLSLTVSLLQTSKNMVCRVNLPEGSLAFNRELLRKALNSRK